MEKWINHNLSSSISLLISNGEGQTIEFKKAISKYSERLGKEIAAFASTNKGTIIIGLDDDGKILGIEGIENKVNRDSLIQRVEGICSGTVKPSITPVIDVVKIEDKLLLVISVPKGKEPIYYVKNIPYKRHLSCSMPADPNDVIYYIKQWLGIDDKLNGEQLEINNFVAELLELLNNISIIFDQSEKRMINPWFEEWRSECEDIGISFRNLAASKIAQQENLNVDLVNLSDALDGLIKTPIYLSGGIDINQLIHNINNLLSKFKEDHLNTITIDDSSFESIKEAFIYNYNKLKILNDRTDLLLENFRDDEMKESASEIGRSILNVSYYEIDSFLNGNQKQLIDIGINLNLLETKTVYCDGGKALNEISRTIKDSYIDYEKLLIDSGILIHRT